MRGYLRGLDVAVLLVRQVLASKDSGSGVLYLACNYLDGPAEAIITILPETVARGDVSQDPQEPCVTCQVADEDGTDAEQSLFPGDLRRLSSDLAQCEAWGQSRRPEDPTLSQGRVLCL